MINGIYLNTQILRRLLNESNVEYKCQECNITNLYNNKPITLHIDHIDGSNTNNQIENLRYLCPNCHSQTDTHGSKNLKNKNRTTKNEFWCNPILEDKESKKATTNKKVKPLINNKCKFCDNTTKRKASVYCSYECYHKAERKTIYTDLEILNILKNNNFNYSKTGKELGISDNAVRKRVKNIDNGASTRT